MSNDLVTERLETLLLARLASSATPPTLTALADDLHRYAPPGGDAPRWRDRVAECLRGLAARGTVDDERRVARLDDLERRTGTRAARWQAWSERILPALALGVRADDAKRPLAT